ncbi:hypothetical protein PAXINDRAFT_81541 [Paxillus involutus ATCC 200175]|uniref:WD40 repeat-like protein n=1 Tax=Paxillus involutus ATCC 200175 TaxID=664439 RepID=A0A0C9U0D6_PAXIN|nr:hypothetical protein PAXINDRAFT_81541 [Paxillus involutus ATCC 200175]
MLLTNEFSPVPYLAPKPLLTISGHEGTVNGIAYLPAGGGLVTCSSDKTVRIWNVELGEQEGMAMEHGGWVRSLAVTKDGKRTLSGGWDKILRVWDMEMHQPIAEWGGHQGFIDCIAMSPDDQLVASGDSDGRILASATRDDTVIRVFDVENGDLILRLIEGHTEWVNSVVWSLDGSWLVTASNDRSILFWDSDTGETIGDPLTGHTFFIRSISLSPDGPKLVSASWDRTIRFWDIDSGDPIGDPLQHESMVQAVTFPPSGDFVACAESSGKVSIWRIPWCDSKKVIAHAQLSCPTISHSHCDCRHTNRC